MELQVLQENLSNALLTAARFTSSRAQLPVLGNIFFNAKKTKLTLLATNLETSIAISLGAKVTEDGEITVPAKTITDVVNNLSSGSLNLKSEKEHLKIAMGSFSAKVLGMNGADFPKVPQALPKEGTLSLPKEALVEALSQTLFAVSVDEARPVLTGVLFVFAKDTLYLVATDGFRLSRKKIAVKIETKIEKAILPKNVLLEVLRLGEEEENLSLALKESENQVLFASGETVLSSRVLDGEFPEYEKIIPKGAEIKVRVDKEELLRAVKLASVFARDSANIVKFTLNKDSLGLSAESSQAGNQEDKIDVKVEGEVKNFEIAFNYRFLEEFLKSVKGEEILMEFSDANAPGVFLDPKDTDYLHLIMPVKVQG